MKKGLVVKKRYLKFTPVLLEAYKNNLDSLFKALKAKLYCKAVAIEKDRVSILLNNSRFLANVLKLDILPGVVFYEVDSTERGKGWQIAHRASGKPLTGDLFKKKNVAFKAALMFLKDIDMTEAYRELVKDSAFKTALRKLNAAANL